MDKKRLLLVYLLFLLLALPVIYFVAKNSQENRSRASGEINLTVQPNTAQITQANSQVSAHFWLNSGAIKLGFVKLVVEFDNTLEVVSISNLTDKLETTISSTSVATANANGKLVFVKGTSPSQLENNSSNPAPSGPIDFVTITFKKKGETGSLTQNNVRFKKSDIQIIDLDGNEWKDDQLTTQGAKYQTSTAGVTATPTNTLTPTPTTTQPSNTPTPTRTPTPTNALTQTPTPTQGVKTITTLNGVINKQSTCVDSIFCYLLQSPANNNYLITRPIQYFVNNNQSQAPLNVAQLVKSLLPNMCIDDRVDNPNCQPLLPQLNNFGQYVGKPVTVKGYQYTYNSRKFLAVTSININITPTATTTHTPTPTLSANNKVSLTFSPGNTQETVNREVTTRLYINNPKAVAIAALNLEFSYSKDVLKITSVTPVNTHFPDVLTAPQIDETNGKFKFALGTGVGGFQSGASIPVADIKFTTLKTSPLTGINLVNGEISAQNQTDNVLEGQAEFKIIVVSSLEGDLDFSNKVDIFDYNILLENFGNTTCGNIADIDGNCKVDIFDYNILLENFGNTI